MRLFAAIPIVEPARSEVVALLGRLRATGWPVRWVGDEGLHLTLKFFGEVAPERLDVIGEALRFAGQGTLPLPLRLDELGAFPSRHHPRILYLGLDGPPALELLQDRLERGGEAIGFPPEGKPFSPHVTLGRLREGQRYPPGALEDHDGSFERVSFIGDQVILYQSILTPRGPQYEPRLTLDLGDR
jgi:RNA 2',3'-cyclic 3'-phosphodiesterase